MSMHNPAHPGEILKELVIEPLGLSITDTVRHLGVSRKTLSKLLKKLCRVSCRYIARARAVSAVV